VAGYLVMWFCFLVFPRLNLIVCCALLLLYCCVFDTGAQLSVYVLSSSRGCINLICFFLVLVRIFYGFLLIAGNFIEANLNICCIGQGCRRREWNQRTCMS
jgi:hypothetical protein